MHFKKKQKKIQKINLKLSKIIHIIYDFKLQRQQQAAPKPGNFFFVVQILDFLSADVTHWGINQFK